MNVYAKQLRQVNRLPKNQTKKTKLSAKQNCNDNLRRIVKDKTMSKELKQHLSKFYKEVKEDFGI